MDNKIPGWLMRGELRFVLLGQWDVWLKDGKKLHFAPEFYEELKARKDVKPLGKTPFEKGWQNKNYRYDRPELLEHIKKGFNYGVIGGKGNLRILDIDDRELGEAFEKKIDTFTVKTGGGGRHFYFISDYNTNHVLINELGELRANNYQVVCPPCKHPSGNHYEIIKDVPIKEISKKELKELLNPYLREDIPITQTTITKPKDTSGSGLEYRRIIALIKGGKSKEQVFNEMQKYSKWTTHGEQHPEYRERTYNKALAYLEKKKKDAFGKAIQFFTSKRNLAEQFLKIQPLHYDRNKNWWLWDDEKYYWGLTDETDILNKIIKHSPAETINSKQRNEVLEALRQVGRATEPKEAKETWLQFNKQIIDINGKEELIASSEYFVTNPISWEIGKSEETPTIDKLFVSWVGKKHKQELYELLAFCLVPDYFIHRIHCLIGSGANGKGTFFKILRKFIGNHNITSTSLDKIIDSRFESAKLYKKLVCLMGETNFSTIKKTQLLKSLTGEDMVGGEFKNKTPFDFDNYAKLIVATNSLPMTLDKTDGYYRRWKIIDFPNKFMKEEDVISGIPEEEYNNLSLKCLNIAKKLWIERVFVNDGNFDARRKRYEEKSNPIGLFIKENYIKDVNGDVVYSDFFDDLNNFISDRGYRTLNYKQVSSQLKSDGYGIKKIGKNNVFTTRILGLKDIKTTDTTQTTQSPIRLHMGNASENKVLLGGSVVSTHKKNKILKNEPKNQRNLDENNSVFESEEDIKPEKVEVKEEKIERAYGKKCEGCPSMADKKITISSYYHNKEIYLCDKCYNELKDKL